MSQYTLAMFILGVACLFLTSSTAVASVISCPPNNEIVSPKLHQLCNAIEQAINEVQVSPLDYRMDERSPAEKKRQDVDHVFLRFGRRFGY
ncbi:unnamed protein product [Brassicogethes aeneus]|uniref:Myosuppressin n=1 Tax=Brassicogethes aeneus TaxID=1431903 RepID=A0A9P0BGI5_BRAAE|nr:unnamed protein product [Brassicogethes aeneus]